MENDQDKLEGRNPDGTFKDGNAGGPGRKPGVRLTWQSYADRLAYWQEQPIKDIIALFEDKPRLNELVMRDGNIVKQLYNSFMKDQSGERENALDREVGRPMGRSELGGPDGGKIPVDNTVTLKIDSA